MPVFDEPSAAVRAFGALAFFGASARRAAARRARMQAGSPAPASPLPREVLTAHEAPQLLARAGLPVMPCAMAGTADEAAAAAKAAEPGAHIDGVLVAPMVKGGVACILGVQRDPVFGPVVMFGIGGILVEAIKDVNFRVAPFDEDEARAMVDEIRARRILDDMCGASPSDVDALVRALTALSHFAAAHADRLESLDLNPFVVLPRGSGAMALDAVLIARTLLAPVEYRPPRPVEC